MNILQAKNEIKNTVQAYLSKDSFGGYEIEAKNQRPLLLIGPPGIGKTQIMEQIAKDVKLDLSAIQLRIIRVKVLWAFLLFKKRNFKERHTRLRNTQ